MDIKKRDVLITSVVSQKSKKTDKSYILINFIDLEDQCNYSVLEEDINVLAKVHGMEKWKINLKLTSSKFGIKLEVTEWLEKLGQI